MDQAILIKALNHNIALCDYRGLEIILFGKGIAFGKQKGDSISFLEADKIYQINDLKNRNAYEQLIQKTPEKIIEVSEEVISLLSKRFGNQYNEKIHVSLLDHLRFALRRLENKISMTNIFGDETKFMYPTEYEFASEVYELINKRLNVSLPESEKSFLTLHIHAALDKEEESFSTLMISVVATCLEVIEQEADLKINENSFLMQRLVTHIKFAVKRSLDKVTLENPLEEVIKEKFPYSYRIAKKLSNAVYSRYGFSFSEGEKGYLSLHIENIIKESEES